MGTYFSTENNENNEKNYKYGWIKDKEDSRDFYMKIENPDNNMHDSINLSDKFPPIYEQGELGSCTANAIAACYQYDEIKQNEVCNFVPSRLFIYYNERQIEGTIYEDSGASIRDGVKTINRIGVVPEEMWPYEIEKFTVTPSKECYLESSRHRAIKYQKLINNLHILKKCLSLGYPFVFGFLVYESFKDDDVKNTGIMKIPIDGEKILGGHAVVAVGYDDDKKHFIIRNSWGSDWGDNGYFYMPYEFITNNEWCDDFWVIEQVRDN